MTIEEIYMEHAKTVYGFLLAKTRDSNLAEELTQETFFRAVRSANQFKGDCNVSTWLCAIAKNVWREYTKKLEKEQRIVDASAQIADAPPNLPPKWEDVDILKAVHSLKEPMREVVYLRLSGNLSFRQIGEIMGKNENWARVTYYRGKEKIMEEVKQND